MQGLKFIALFVLEIDSKFVCFVLLTIQCWPMASFSSDSMSRQWRSISSYMSSVGEGGGRGLDLVSGSGLLVTATPCVLIRLLDVCELYQTSQLETTSERSKIRFHRSTSQLGSVESNIGQRLVEFRSCTCERGRRASDNCFL